MNTKKQIILEVSEKNKNTEALSTNLGQALSMQSGKKEKLLNKSK